MSDDEEATVQVGQVLGDRYEVTRLIGKGGMGTVVEAHHRTLGEAVALKILHPRYLDNAEAVARFQQEARAAVQIRGEHSARLIDVGTAPTGAPFLVMELLTGEDLAAVGARGPQPVEAAVGYILQACEGMAEVHAHGIVHRDLKPGNLFLTTAPDGSPLIKVLDFGIAKNVARDPSIGTLTMTLVALGTPLYMAPEQIRSSRTVDARADVWSLGAILYELITGEAAFGGNTVAHITAQVLEAEPTLMTKIRPEVPRELEAAILRALAKDVDKRWVDVAAFAAAIAPFAPDGAASAARTARILSLGIFAGETPIAATLDGDDARLPGTGRFQPSLLGRRRRSRVLVGAALAAAVVLLGFGIAAGAPWEPEAPGRVVAVSGVRNVALQRIGYASMTARVGSSTTKSISAAAAPGAQVASSPPDPAAPASPAASTPASTSAKEIDPPPPLPPRGPTGKPMPPAPPPPETQAPTAPPPPPRPPPPAAPGFDPLGTRK